MVWFKVDDGFWSHPKVLELSDAAVSLWTRAGAYCAGQLTDGKVTKPALRMLAAERDAATELVLAGLWDEHEKGWIFHDWADYQPTREEVMKERAASTERQRAARAKRMSQRESHRDIQRDSRGIDAVITPVSHSAPTRPDPTRPLSTSNEVERALSPFCKKHPNGTDGACRACGTARIGYEASKAAEKSKPTLVPRRDPTCTIHAEYPLPCDRCARDAAEGVAS